MVCVKYGCQPGGPADTLGHHLNLAMEVTTMTNSTRRRGRRKAGDPRPPKPYRDFPLTPHSLGYWCKSIRGKVKYFGRWGRRVNGKMERLPDDGWQTALDEYNRTRDALYQGKTPRPKAEGLTLADLCNRYLTSKHRLLDAGELAPRTFRDYKGVCDRLVAFFGGDRTVLDLAADDFEALRSSIAKTAGPVRLGGEIQQTRMVFKYAYDAALIDKPVRYGPTFKRPSKRVLRKAKQANGSRMFERHEIRTLLDAAPVQLRAMILLGVNSGFGNADCGTLPLSALDLEGGWIDYPRPKTGIERRCPLWPETVEALQEVVTNRPEPKKQIDSDLVFLTQCRLGWTKDSSANPISAEFRKLLQSVGLYRKGRGFYALRHVFQTIGEEAGETACRFIMGHADSSMSGVYRERISDERLRAVTDHVHSWLFGEGGQSDV